MERFANFNNVLLQTKLSFWASRNSKPKYATIWSFRIKADMLDFWRGDSVTVNCDHYTTMLHVSFFINCSVFNPTTTNHGINKMAATWPMYKESLVVIYKMCAGKFISRGTECLKFKLEESALGHNVIFKKLLILNLSLIWFKKTGIRFIVFFK